MLYLKIKGDHMKATEAIIFVSAVVVLCAIGASIAIFTPHDEDENGAIISGYIDKICRLSPSERNLIESEMQRLHGSRLSITCD